MILDIASVVSRTGVRSVHAPNRANVPLEKRISVDNLGRGGRAHHRLRHGSSSWGEVATPRVVGNKEKMVLSAQLLGKKRDIIFYKGFRHTAQTSFYFRGDEIHRAVAHRRLL